MLAIKNKDINHLFLEIYELCPRSFIAFFKDKNPFFMSLKLSG